MRIGFDLDGTLDRPHILDLALMLLDSGHEIHIITGIYDEAGDWQNEEAKIAKINGLRIPCDRSPAVLRSGVAQLHMLHAANLSFGQDYRLRDLGLRK